jgi:hypothetical protein
MKRKPIKIDWDALEEAFTNPSHEEMAYLDGVTGHMVLEGEGEEDQAPDDDEDAEVRAPGGPPPRLRQDPTLIRIEPPDLETKIEWLGAFLDAAPDLDRQVVSELNEASATEDPAEALGEVLKRHPAVRDRWYLYRAERLHEWIDEWLAAHGVEAVDPAPWR